MTTTEPRYPNVEVPMVGQDGNAFAVLGRVRKALRRSGVDPATISDFTTEATNGDYDHLLQTVCRWVQTS